MDAKERIIEQLKRSGCRVTKQRLMLIDVILEGKCNCCKEIYYQASLKDPSIGPATVYRMVNTLEPVSYTHLYSNRNELCGMQQQSGKGSIEGIGSYQLFGQSSDEFHGSRRNRIPVGDHCGC